MSKILTRRALVGSLVAGAGTLISGCDKLGDNPDFQKLLKQGERGNYGLQRLLQDNTALATEYAPNQRSPIFRSNGTAMPVGEDYARHVAAGFADWTLVIDGMVARPQTIALNEIRNLPHRSQITRHDCVEGWSAIAKWTGTPLKLLLDRAGVSPQANYVVFHCADANDGAPYYESIDRIDAAHPQTMLAWALNDQYLPVANGAPLRLRVERQLGYKHAKYVNRLELVSSLKGIRGGNGGFWEDAAGYQWYAGI
ncbi:molybdopterin-binding protein [Sphingomonas paeninsulae]|jgi:DMSO/TMAO reductase YedYZ molybdopterin-dependent catalytic subunit|uniref:Molybdopterin-binding protein n=1 Tax=Sphingomonas paeninsulae TaxID=2319844 RepID=A0A494TG41_SPHPE|nr:molybdopterin-dependent oxidoreductase [Sphingomonas paeninsulae]AYJ86252.1 molybdopterin-binding protein [Sphingomonas paeninsulae]